MQKGLTKVFIIGVSLFVVIYAQRTYEESVGPPFCEVFFLGLEEFLNNLVSNQGDLGQCVIFCSERTTD